MAVRQLFSQSSGYATSKAGKLRLAECVGDVLARTGVLLFAIDPGLARTSMTQHQPQSAAGRKFLSDVDYRCAEGINMSPKLAARMSVEIARGEFDTLAGCMLMGARDDLTLGKPPVERIVARDLRSLHVNGMPPETP